MFINPSYADKTFLPLSLLLAKTFLPERELILFLKPWSFFLLRLFGWYVLSTCHTSYKSSVIAHHYYQVYPLLLYIISFAMSILFIKKMLIKNKFLKRSCYVDIQYVIIIMFLLYQNIFYPEGAFLC